MRCQMVFKWTVETFRILPARGYDDIRLHLFLYWSGLSDHSTINIDCNSNLKKSNEWNKLYTNKTKWKTILYCETNQISSSSHVFECKNRTICACGWQFEAIFRISGVWHVGWWNLITSVRLIQVGNNRNDHFRYCLGVRVRLLEVSAY